MLRANPLIMISSLPEGMGAVNQLQSQGLGMTKDLSKTSDDLIEKVRQLRFIQKMAKSI